MAHNSGTRQAGPGSRWEWLNRHRDVGLHLHLENRRLEAMDGIQRNFTYPWASVAEHADYRTFVQAEALRIGADHPLFRTQSVGKRLTSAGRLFSAHQLSEMEILRASSAHPAPVRPGAPEVLDDAASNPSHPLSVETPSSDPSPPASFLSTSADTSSSNSLPPRGGDHME